MTPSPNVFPNEQRSGAERLFVRSQSQLAIDNPAATGQRLTRSQVEDAFGVAMVQRVEDEDVVSLVESIHEPARTLREKRLQLGLAVEQLARSARLSPDVVRDAETPGKIVPIQSLNELCQFLAIDESILGYKPAAGGDEQLGVRLRLLAENRDVRAFSAATVAALTEAAWVIAKQMKLSELISRAPHSLARHDSHRDANYQYPAYRKGYLLAERTRKLLGLAAHEPIASVRVLVEDVLRIPLIQAALETRFAGATLANGAYRGIVVNERGKNSEVAVRRMTTCHELAHLLWDPDQQLDRLLVDDYESIEGRPTGNDPVEIRANSFAVAFLAPRSAVLEMVQSSSNLGGALTAVCERFGISVSAARHHVHNVCEVETQNVRMETPDFSPWLAAENRTIDFLPGLDADVPISRKGMFAGIVAKAYIAGEITADTAAMCLKAPREKIPAAAPAIADIWGLLS